MRLSITGDFSLLSYTFRIFPSGINSFNEYVFHIYNMQEILLDIIKSETIAITPAFKEGDKMRVDRYNVGW